jgi:MoaA/NifB/PqqE/SkfB family radical SAM enzyme
MQEMTSRAQWLGIPLGVQLDLTYRCNERCVHCYLDHEDHGEMNTVEIRSLLDQMAAAGVLFLTISGGEIMMRRDFFEIFEHARRFMFHVKLKTNAVMIRETEADRIQALAPESVQISVYSHRPEVHDTITKLPGSLKRSLAGARLLVERGVRVIFANVLMQDNFQDYSGVQAMASAVGAQYTVDPTITPMMDGDRSTLTLNIARSQLEHVFRDSSLLGTSVEEFCAPPEGPLVPEDSVDTLPCSAGHTFCYVSPYGGVPLCAVPAVHRECPHVHLHRYLEAFHADE